MKPTEAQCKRMVCVRRRMSFKPGLPLCTRWLSSGWTLHDIYKTGRVVWAFCYTSNFNWVCIARGNSASQNMYQSNFLSKEMSSFPTLNLLLLSNVFQDFSFPCHKNVTRKCQLDNYKCFLSFPKFSYWSLSNCHVHYGEENKIIFWKYFKNFALKFVQIN